MIDRLNRIFHCPQCNEEYEIIKGFIRYCPECKEGNPECKSELKELVYG